MASALDAFATGALNGYTTGLKAKQQQELHDMQMQRYRDEKEMADAFKNLETGIKPQELAVVTRPDGKTVAYENRQMAEEAAAALGEGARVGQRFALGDKQFADKDSASAAAEAMTSPAALARQRAEIAMKYNRPDLADQYTKAYTNILDANRRDMQEQFLQARETGDYTSVLNSVNGRLKNGGAQAQLVPGPDGSLAYQVVKGDQVLSNRQFKSPDEFWDAMGQQVAQTPANMLESWKARKGLEMDERRTVVAEKGQQTAERVADANIINDGRRVDIADAAQKSQAQIGMANVGVAQGQLGVAQGQLGVAQDRQKLAKQEFDHTAAQAYNPKWYQGTDAATGEQTVYGVATTPQGGLRMVPAQRTGTQPAKPDMFGSMMRPQPAAGSLKDDPTPEQWRTFASSVAKPAPVAPAAAARPGSLIAKPALQGLIVPPQQTAPVPVDPMFSQIPR